MSLVIWNTFKSFGWTETNSKEQCLLVMAQTLRPMYMGCKLHVESPIFHFYSFVFIFGFSGMWVLHYESLLSKTEYCKVLRTLFIRFFTFLGMKLLSFFFFWVGEGVGGWVGRGRLCEAWNLLLKPLIIPQYKIVDLTLMFPGLESIIHLKFFEIFKAWYLYFSLIFYRSKLTHTISMSIWFAAKFFGAVCLNVYKVLKIEKLWTNIWSFS